MRIVIIEAGDTYIEQAGCFEADLAGSEGEMVEQAKALVKERGCRVMPGPEAESEGGCCEYCQEIDAYGNVQESIAITVYPEEPTRA